MWFWRQSQTTYEDVNALFWPFSDTRTFSLCVATLFACAMVRRLLFWDDSSLSSQYVYETLIPCYLLAPCSDSQSGCWWSSEIPIPKHPREFRYCRIIAHNLTKSGRQPLTPSTGILVNCMDICAFVSVYQNPISSRAVFICREWPELAGLSLIASAYKNNCLTANTDPKKTFSIYYFKGQERTVVGRIGEGYGLETTQP